MPPRTWRIQPRWNGDIDSLGITSTYVENTLNMHLPLMHQQDHLHIRGEYNTSPSVYPAGLGSPPHTWRILPVFTRYKVPNGITSTYVENTSFLASTFEQLQDHLHIRGEYGTGSVASLANKGSPPHTWRILDQ